MKFLIIEDDPNKSRQIMEFLKEDFDNASIAECRSYRSGLNNIIKDPPEVLILDMTMPTYDISSTEKGGRTRAYAGMEILGEIKRKKINLKVIIVTQFENFGEGGNIMTLEEIKDLLLNDFPNHYLCTISYQPSEAKWRKELSHAIKGVIVK